MIEILKNDGIMFKSEEDEKLNKKIYQNVDC